MQYPLLSAKDTMVLRFDGSRNVSMQLVSGRSVMISTNSPKVEAYPEDKRKLDYLRIGNVVLLNVHDSICRLIPVEMDGEPTIYVVRQIIRQEPPKGAKTSIFFADTHPRTKSSYFIPPMLFDSHVKISWDKYFINSHIVYRDSTPMLGMYVRNVDSRENEHFIENIVGHPNFCDHIDGHPLYPEDSDCLMIVYEVPDEYSKDFGYLLTSSYSKFSEKFKEKILAFNQLNKTSEMYHILTKAPVRRTQLEMELNAPIPPDIELFDGLETGVDFVILNDINA